MAIPKYRVSLSEEAIKFTMHILHTIPEIPKGREYNELVRILGAQLLKFETNSSSPSYITKDASEDNSLLAKLGVTVSSEGETDIQKSMRLEMIRKLAHNKRENNPDACTQEELEQAATYEDYYITKPITLDSIEDVPDDVTDVTDDDWIPAHLDDDTKAMIKYNVANNIVTKEQAMSGNYSFVEPKSSNTDELPDNPFDTLTTTTLEDRLVTGTDEHSDITTEDL